MVTPIFERLVDSVEVESHLLPYLEYSGWHRVDQDNARWIVMNGPDDAEDHPLQLVFPRERSSVDWRSYMVKAAEVLSVLTNQPIELMLQDILFYDRDQLHLRNTETEEEIALPLHLAVSQVNNIKGTVQFSACSEREAKPYFRDPLPSSKKVLKTFTFGHTFAGSFGFTVQAPRLPDPPGFIQPRMDLKDDYIPPVNIPYERRIVERIARGLLFAKKAEETQDINLLINEYPSGFNGNMCSAVAAMSRERLPNVEFKVIWSPKLKPSEDIAEAKPIMLRTSGYDLLEYAAERLRTVEPEFTTITGNVRSLTASDNPQSTGTRRAVVVRGLHPGSSHAISVIIELPPHDYALASEAHITWATVQATGVLTRTGLAWRLSNIKSFHVIRR